MSELDISYAIVSPNRKKYSETFIHNHINFLPGDKHLLYGGYLPTSFEHGERKGRISKKLFGRFRKETEESLRFEVLRYFLENEISFVLAEYGPTGVQILDACANAGIPLIVHFHGYDAFRQDILTSYGKRYRELFEYSSLVAVVSEQMRSQLISLGCSPAKIAVNHYGISTDLFRPTQCERGSDILFVGRFVRKKNPDTILSMFEDLSPRFPSSRLIMVGDGPLLEKCKNMAAESIVSDKVIFKGILDQTDIADLMRQCGAFVLNSGRAKDGDSEGLPLVLLEAAACAAPIVTTKHAGISEVFDRNSAILVEEGENAGFENGLRKLLSNQEFATGLGLMAYQKITTEHRLEHKLGMLWLKIIESLNPG